MNRSKLHGLIAATVTPFAPGGALDLDQIAPITDRLIDSGVSGLYVCGSTGEGMSLSTTERKQVAAAFVDAADGRVPVIVQVGHNSLREAQDLASHAGEVGADVISATCPSYFKVASTDGLIDCMRQIVATAGELPFYYYHIPALTGSQIDIVDFLRRGSEAIPNLVGLKYTDTLLHEFQSCQSVHDGNLDIVWGCDEMLLGALATGATAAIGSTYNVAAALYTQIVHAFEHGDLELARELQRRSVAMVEAMAAVAFHPALKETMAMLGMPCGGCRLPLGTLTADQVDALRHALTEIDFFQWCGHET